MIKIREYVPLAPLTTFRIGGPARFYLDAISVDDVIEGLEFARSRGLEVFVLGGGSNLLVSDEGVNALVIRVAIERISFDDGSGGQTHVTSGAGVVWDELVETCVKKRLAGIECLSGIPGLVGGTPIQNVGAYGQEVSNTIVSVKCLDRTNCRVVDLKAGVCEFSYRSSIFNTDQKERYIVLGVTYALKKGGKPTIAYKDLSEIFSGREPELREVRAAVLDVRRSKSMVIDPQDPNSRSAGSFFRNPLVDRSDLDKLERKFGRVPHFEAGDKMKIPAAWLIENSGFKKGYSTGNVGISDRHSLALVNRGGGTAREILALKTLIQKAVFDRFGIELVPEPIFVGFSSRD